MRQTTPTWPRSPQWPASQTIWTLDAYCTTGSLHQAAEFLHLHHSSVARRLGYIGKTLSIELTEPTGMTRARLALAAWRLLNK